MRKLPNRQVHLDFHTSEDIPGVGSAFSKENFQEALRLGHLNSITVFAKGHHGWCYYPTEVGHQHPTMQPGFDLTGAMIDAAHEIGVDCPVYITAGWSANDARLHPEWAARNKDGSVRVNNIDPNAGPDNPRPTGSWVHLCLNAEGEYANLIYRHTREICDRYEDLDGLFFDIVYLGETCYCPTCLSGMKKAGLDPENLEDARSFYKQTHIEFAARCEAILREKHPEATIFFNSGGAEIYRPEYHASQTHYEMEDLPTTWGGYNKMPPRADVMGRYGKDFLGMTGKFHTSWGEFGGYKNPEALRFEVAMMAMYGAGCSVGDQMPPSGRMDLSTYRLIGHAYEYLESIEPWCGGNPTATLGVMLSGNGDSDGGLHSMLLEKQLDFRVLLPGDDLSGLDTLILPDEVQLTDKQAAKLQSFVENGGGVLLTGTSAVKDGRFQLDTGLVYEGPGTTDVDYLAAPAALTGWDWLDSPFLCYISGERTRIIDAEVLASVYEPYFSRTYAHYCSHQYTPYRDKPAVQPGITRKGRVIYMAHKLCAMYNRDGAQLFRDSLVGALSLIYDPVLKVGMPSGGRVRLVQRDNDLILHLMYGQPIQRGRTSVIEDLPEIRQIPVTIRTDRTISRVLLQPCGEELPFTLREGVLTFTVPSVQCHAAIQLL